MLICLSGQMSSGKDSVADHLVSNYGFVKVAQADPIKRIVREVYGFTDEQLWGPSQLRNTPDKRYLQTTFERHSWVSKNEGEWRCERCGADNSFSADLIGGHECLVYLTPREALQRFGTQGGRDSYLNTWVDLAIRTVRQLLDRESNLDYSGSRGLFPKESGKEIKGVVITDCRFFNEIDAFRAEKAWMWRIHRPRGSSSLTGSAHVSETEQKDFTANLFDEVVDNNADLPALYAQVDARMRDRGSWTS